MNTQSGYNVSFCTDPKFKLQVIKRDTEEKCDICLLSLKNPVQYGEFIVREFSSLKIKCHYFCLLTGTLIPQRGVIKSGITGFLIRDIVASFREYRYRNCVYCQCPSAPIRCAKDGCDRWFHYPCGYDNSCLTQFCDQFNSFCHLHVPEEYYQPQNTKDKDCEICFEELPQLTDANFNILSVIQSCNKPKCPPGLMHRTCLQRFAYTSGYNFKCPLCFRKDFKIQAIKRGIFVPSRESAWEREVGAYKDIHKRKCTAAHCILAKTCNEKNASTLVGCKICGGQLMHRVCTQLADSDVYLCANCMQDSFVNLV
ncbi:PHD finger protein 7-like [Anopheles nili]|uniref:PHD finger protein 7-like n=1 Tax=Anopheles nili TaxID=185578 RepID=UPI00237B9718|nr:PHD finger protein 7-like [Anopheles nili]